MILNAYAVLDAFLGLLRLGLGLFVLYLGVAAWRTWSQHASVQEDRKALEDRCYLLFLLGGFLLCLNVIAWPVFYLLLQSYVPEWPGVMCIYGVTRIGTGSLGPSRFLPSLVTGLQFAKPALVFLSGAWFVLYLLNRHTRTAPLTGRVVLVLLAAGLLAVADAAAEVAYVAIPKKEEFLSGGCCTGVFDTRSHTSRFLPAALVPENEDWWLYAAYFGVNAALVLGSDVCARLCRRQVPRAGLLSLLVLAGLGVVVNGVFLVEIAAPRLLGLPYHHCPYDLVPRAPESLVAVALFLGGTFAVGWACVAAWLGSDGEVRPLLPESVGRLLRIAVFGYLLSLVMMSVELAARWWHVGRSG
jgi:hypothetical protein